MTEPERHAIAGPVGTPVGWRSKVTRCVALAVVLSDVMRPCLQSWFQFQGLDRPLLVLAGLLAILCLYEGDLPALGFRLTPAQGWSYWFRLGLWFGFVIGILCAICGAIWWLCGWPIPVHRMPPSLDALIHFCVRAPVEEELIYRSLLVVAVLPTCGTRWTILISGLVFALIHVLGGNPGPDNQIAGFMLAWAFLKSKTILVPIAMHSAGNLIALSAQIASWYWLT